MSGVNILFALTGSIACHKACAAISRLVQAGHRVRCVATASALRFVGEAALEGLTGERVRTDLFAAGGALDHIQLTRWADVTIVCPATAHTINRFAAGLGDDLLGTLFLARDPAKPWLVAPAMNPEMWKHPATGASVGKLRSWGVRFLLGEPGRTACGEVGEGRLLEPEGIVAEVEAAARKEAKAGKGAVRLRVLITSGGTAEPIDAVRVITNSSTGRTGAAIADYLAGRGHDVVLLHAKTAVSASRPAVKGIVFGSFADLDRELAEQLANADFDAVIHAAAVSDFAVEAVEVAGRTLVIAGGKLESDEAPVIRLRRLPKLLDGLRQRSRKPLRVVAFKLTADADEAGAKDAVAALLARAQPDWVVHNDASAADGVFPATIFDARGEIVAKCADRREIAPALERLLLALADGS